MEENKEQNTEQKDIIEIKLDNNENENNNENDNNNENENNNENKINLIDEKINENSNEEVEKNEIVKNIDNEIILKENEEEQKHLNIKSKIIFENSSSSKNDSSKDIINPEQDINTASIENKTIKNEGTSCIKFIKDEKNDSMKDSNSSNNNLYFLDNLFRDVVNKYDTENKDDYDEPRQLIRKTLTKSKIPIENQNIENESFNFNDLINVQLNEVKQNTLSYLDKVKLELDKKYSLYINKVNEYIKENEKKISKFCTSFETNENFMNYADDKIFKQIDNLLEIHENIFSALEDHISLLFTFLDEYNLIQQKNPLENFLNTNSSDILNCWFLSKISFDKLSLSNFIINKDLSDLVTGYLSKKTNNNFAKITISKDTIGNLSFETEFLRDNINNLKKLKFVGLPSDTVKTILTQLKKKKKENTIENDDDFIDINQDLETPVGIGKKLKSLSIIESNIITNKDAPLPKINLPVLAKVKIKKSKLPLDYFFDSIVGQTSFLRIINMQNCRMTDKDFNIFFSYLSNKKHLQDSLQYLGFSENQLSYINLKQFVDKGGHMKSLQYFDLNKNNIYEFVTDNFKALPSLKVLDLTDNNISNFSFFDTIYSKHKKKKMPCIVLLCNNLFVSNNKENNKKYRKYIYECLPAFKYKIKKVNLSLLFNKDNNEELYLLRISPYVKISMIKLNLSYCGLKTETVWKLLQNNYGLLNLVSLILSYNFITNNFFILCGGQDISLEKLRSIDLSMNQIRCSDINSLENIEKFINNFQKLKKIKIQENFFMKDLFLLYESKKEQIEEIIERLNKKEFKFDVDTSNHVFHKEKLRDIINLKDKSII